MNEEMIRRDEALRFIRQWLDGPETSFAIIAPRHTGKTFLVKQLVAEGQLAAVYYASRADPESLETAAFLQSIATQLVDRFPSLIIPKFRRTTLLSIRENVINHFLIEPLLALSIIPSSPSFIAIDGVENEILPLIQHMAKVFPKWLRLLITIRTDRYEEANKLENFIIHELDRDNKDLLSFIQHRLPKVNKSRMLEACEGSWFYIDQYSHLLNSALSAASSCTESIAELALNLTKKPPRGEKALMELVETHLPIHSKIYMELMSASRQPASRDKFISAARMILGTTRDIVDEDLLECEVVLESDDPLRLKSAWYEKFQERCSQGHTFWAEYMRRTGFNAIQDLIEFAYHLAHSKEWKQSDKIELLQNLGADLIELRCPVIDTETNELLRKAGAVMIDQSSQSDFVYACSSGDWKAVRECMNLVDDDDVSHGLISAASRGYTEICRYILKSRPQAAYFVDARNWNAFRSAACNNHVDVVDLLIRHGIDVDESGCEGRTALRAAAWSGQEAVVARLLQYDANVDKCDKEGRTSLMVSSYKNHFGIVSMLLDAGADPNATDVRGLTALHLAISSRDTSENHDRTVFELIERNADVNIADKTGSNCVHHAAYYGDKSLEELLKRVGNVDAQDNRGCTPLMLAASQGYTDACEILLANNANLDSIDNDGRTAVIHAAMYAQLDTVRLLINRGADEAHKDNDGAVALHFAAVHNDLELCKILCNSVTVRCADHLGIHPLILAAQRFNEQIVELFLNFGAPIHLQSHDGQSSLRVAALAHNEAIVRCIVSYILESGDRSDLAQCDLSGTPLLHSLIIAHDSKMTALLCSLGAPTSVRDAHKRSCTHIVAQVNDLKIAAILKDFDADFEDRDEAGRTPLMTAVWANKYDIACYLLEVIGVSPNNVDSQGVTALNIAAHTGQRDFVILLLKFGAEPMHCDKLGRNAADIAQIAGHELIRQILNTASGSADSSGFGSLRTSPSEPTMKYSTKPGDSRNAESLLKGQKSIAHCISK